MTAQPQTLVIGGGVIGVATLFELASRGVPAVLLEAGPELAAGASHANGGMLTPAMSDPWNGPGVASQLLRSVLDPHAALKVRLRALPMMAGWGLKFLLHSSPLLHQAATRANFSLARRSLERITQLWDEVAPAKANLARGSLKLFSSRAAFEAQRSNAAGLAPLGLVYEILGPREILAKEPQLAAAQMALAHGLYFPDDRFADAQAFTHALAAKAVAAGGQIATKSAVRRIVVRRGRVVGVETERAMIEASRVVIAAGDRSAALAAKLGVRLAIKPAKGYSVTIDAAGWNDGPCLPVIDDAMHAVVVPLGDKLRCVSSAEFAGYDARIDERRIAHMLQLMKRLYPHLAARIDRNSAFAWAGLRPMSADGLPIIGPSAVPGLWIHSGHGHLGWTMAAGSAELLVDMMLDCRLRVDPQAFRVAR